MIDFPLPADPSLKEAVAGKLWRLPNEPALRARFEAWTTSRLERFAEVDCLSFGWLGPRPRDVACVDLASGAMLSYSEVQRDSLQTVNHSLQQFADCYQVLLESLVRYDPDAEPESWDERANALRTRWAEIDSWAVAPNTYWDGTYWDITLGDL